MEEDVQKILSLIDLYWDAAYAEGASGRSHDTPEGTASDLRLSIEEELLKLAEAKRTRRGQKKTARDRRGGLPETVWLSNTWRYPDEGNPLWHSWVEVDPSNTHAPKGIKQGDTIQWLLAHERYNQVFRAYDFLVDTNPNLALDWSTQSANDQSSIVAFRIKKEPWNPQQ